MWDVHLDYRHHLAPPCCWWPEARHGGVFKKLSALKEAVFRDWTQAWCYTLSGFESEAEPLYETLDEQAEGVKKKINGKPQLRTGEVRTAVVGRRSSRFKMSLCSCDQHENLYDGTWADVLSDSEVKCRGPACVVCIWLPFLASLPAWKPVGFWAFTSSLVSESLFKSQIESIFVHFKLCNAHHLFLLTEKKM